MLRSAILALDTTEASAKAIDVTINFYERRVAAGYKMKLTGVGVVDRPTIERSQPMPAGAMAFKEHRDKALLADAQKKVGEVLDNFEAKCRAHGIACETIRAEGVPHEQIEAIARRHDMIVIGKDTDFHFETGGEPGETVKRLLRENPRPVFVVTNEVPQGNRVVLAYDGSDQSAKALHLWILLGLRDQNVEVHVVSVDEELARAESFCQDAAALLTHHDVAHQLHPIATEDDVVPALMTELQALDPLTVVLGAYGHGGLKAKFFGTVTDKILADCNYPLFLFH